METSLRDYVAKNGQSKTAQQLGLQPSSLSQALASDRDIRVVTKGKSITAYEIKPFPSSSAKKRGGNDA
ncbi:Cro [compost metagenome]